MSFPFAGSGPPPRSVKEGYERWALNYDEMLTDNLDGPVLASFLPLLPGGPVDAADLGCGTGRTGAWLRRRLEVRSLAGVDLSPAMLERARAKSLYDRLLLRDLGRTGLEGDAFDLVCNVLSACHLPGLAPLYDEARRLLRPGGRFLLVDYHPHMLLSGQGTRFPDVDGNTVSIENHVHLLRDHHRAARERGLAFLAFDESLVTRAWLEQGLRKEAFLHHPVGFGFLWQKAGGAGDAGAP